MTAEAKTPEHLYFEREKRVMDAITLKKPDRVPVWGGVPGLFPSQHLGISREEQMMDVDKSLEGSFQAALYFEPDMVEMMPALGSVLAPLDYKQLRWAGRGLPPGSGWQFLEIDCMKPEEYDELIYDPSDFIIRKYWPRAYGKLAAFANLLPLREAQGYFAAPFAFLPFGTPEGLEALDALREAGQAALRSVMATLGHGRRLKEGGFPMAWTGATQPPFDLVGDFLRGRKGIMLDMYREPEKLALACEKLLPMAVEMGVRGARMSSNPRVFIAVHGGVEGFMSNDQYRRFFWPTFRELMVRLADEGLHPFVLVEGRSRLAARDHGRRACGKGLLLVRPRGHGQGERGAWRRSLPRRQRAACLAHRWNHRPGEVLLQGAHRHGGPGRRVHPGPLRSDGRRQGGEREDDDRLHEGIRGVLGGGLRGQRDARILRAEYRDAGASSAEAADESDYLGAGLFDLDRWDRRQSVDVELDGRRFGQREGVIGLTPGPAAGEHHVAFHEHYLARKWVLHIRVRGAEWDEGLLARGEPELDVFREQVDGVSAGRN